MKLYKGSITIFALWAMLLVMTTLFSLLEFSRFYQIRELAALQTEAAVESAFAGYSSYLWNYYHLLGCDNTRILSVTESMGNSRVDETTGRTNLFLFEVKETKLKEYTLLTDGNGTAYIHAVADYMEKHIFYDTAKEVFNQYEAVQNMIDTNYPDVSKIDTAVKELENAEAEKETASEGTSIQRHHGISVHNSKNQKKNILTEIQEIQKKGILELVLEDTGSISEKTISLTEAVSHRKLSEGSQIAGETEWMDRVWLQQYMLSEMSYFGKQKDGHSMLYEVEYLIGGKEYDYENLKTVVTELLFIREAANLLYLMSDVKKVEEAGILAAGLAGVSGNPILIETVQAGILAAWALGESILDVRALMQNKKIPLIKNESLWTLELENVADISKGFLTAKSSDKGLSYQDYLGILLLFEQEQQIALRGMDLQEVTLQKLYGNENIRMDQFVTRAKVQVSYTYSTIFPLPDMIKNRWDDTILVTEEFGYY